jgi:hypothetical protein
MVSSIQRNNFKTSLSNVSFNLSNDEIYLSISLHSRRKSIVFYSRIMAITRSDELRHSPAVRVRLILWKGITKRLLGATSLPGGFWWTQIAGPPHV